jgi:Right handed beta helix region
MLPARDGQLACRRSPAGRVLLLLAVSAVLAQAQPVTAATVYVDCTGGSPGAFTSLNAAISSLTGPPPAVGDWDYILLKSNCTENVVITGGRRVWIAPDGSQCPYSGCPWSAQPLRIAAASPTANVIDITGPQDVTLVHLILSGGSTGLNAVGAANVTAFDVTAEDNTGAGLSAGQGASLTINEGGARRNGWYGIVVGSNATGTLQGQVSWLHGQPVDVSANAGGIWVDRGVLVGASGITVEENRGPGLVSFGGDLLWGAYTGETLVRNNQGGAFLSERSQASIWRSGTGITTFRDNGAYGLYIEKSSHASLYGTVVEGHTGVGVDVGLNSQVHLQGVYLRQNGSAGGPDQAGVRVDGNSEALLDGASEITGNGGPGIVADLNSSIDVREGVIITGNSREGIRVNGRSVLSLARGSAVTPNGGSPVTCDSVSNVISSVALRSRACTNVTRPRHPRPVRPSLP